ncbi:MAG: tRNA 2-thiouridine(34) synthase MnmA [Patescibacteria group bacterium]|nr:tRNA 2-thiouridine(34) synthase MnmA [Patescibacteria group bacterium]
MKKNNNKMVAIAMSGGIDSAVAAFLLQGKYQIFGLTMFSGSFGKSAIKNAKIICQRLKIPHYVVNLEKEFKREIIKPFAKEYANGRTPNPCIWCNEKIKFGLLLKKAEKLGANFLATGHYARITREISNFKFQISNKSQITNSKNRTIYKLLKAKDKAKDQSYFLYRLKQSQLKKIIFPLGDLTKEEVKKIAVKNKLLIKEQKESHEICFIPDNDYRKFLKNNLRRKTKKGVIKNLRGKIIGEHQGLPFYTVGQRKGLIKGQKRPFYVVKMDNGNNTLTVGGEKDLYQKEFTVGRINWLDGKEIKNKKKITVKIRYCHPDILVDFLKWQQNGKLDVKLKKPQKAVTPGQSAVFYNKDEVLGGGVIEK